MSGRARTDRAESGDTLPAHPYRDSGLLHVVLGLLLLVVAWVTGGGLARAAVVAGLYVAVAVGWSWYRFRQRIRRRTRAASQGSSRR